MGVCSIILLLSSEEVILSISNREISSSSFRDPSGSVFCENNEVYRQVNLVYKPHYDLLIESGLYEALIQSDLLIAHEEIEFRIEIEQQKRLHCDTKSGFFKIGKPCMVPCISYPYESCFSLL